MADMPTPDQLKKLAHKAATTPRGEPAPEDPDWYMTPQDRDTRRRFLAIFTPRQTKES